MSRLRLLSSPGYDVEVRTSETGDEPVILSLKSYRQLLDDGKLDHVVERARLVHRNSRCPHCSHPIVDPIELNDGFLNRNRMPVPGTATLVGFHCHGCHREWPA